MATDPTGLCGVLDVLLNRDQCGEYFVEAAVENFKEDKEEITSTAVSMIPIAGDIEDWQEALTGVDLITGRELSLLERGITAVAAVVPCVGGAALRKGADALGIGAKQAGKDATARVAKEAIQRESADLAADAAAKTGRKQADQIDDAMEAKKAEASGPTGRTCKRNPGLQRTCFGAGTLVATEQGLVPIEEIKVDDRVYAYDVETQSVELKQVEHLFSRKADEIYVLSAGTETIRTTNEHPFYVEGEGWVEAEKLHVGDLLRTKSGDTVRLDKIEMERGGDWVFNFAVEELATYFVSEEGLLVHNCDDLDLSEGVLLGEYMPRVRAAGEKTGARVWPAKNWDAWEAAGTEYQKNRRWLRDQVNTLLSKTARP